jgi:hypothetical protein
MQSRKIFRKSILEDLLNEGETQEKVPKRNFLEFGLKR